MKIRVHSFESFGTVDGPGIRFVIFLKGCPLRCQYCHNPDTWDERDGKKILMETEELVRNGLRYRSYYGQDGGVTFSGGEPLVQIDAVTEALSLFKKNKIHTCIDTCGYMFDRNDSRSVEKHKELIKYADLFLLDLKQMDDEKHKKLTGVSNARILDFARFLSDNGKKMWIRRVLVPGLTDDEEELGRLKKFIDSLNGVEKVEILPYHTMGEIKYERLNLEYPLKGVRTPTKEEVIRAKEILGIAK